MELTEANLREHNDAPSCSSSPSREESPAAQIRRSKEGIVCILRSLRYFGPQGLKYIDDADVCIDDNGVISCRGDEPPGDDDAVFWTRQVEDLESKFYPLQRAVNGPPKEIIIDYEAQREQDRIDQFHASWKRKMQLWSSDDTQFKQLQHISPPLASHDSTLLRTESFSSNVSKRAVIADKPISQGPVVRQAAISQASKTVLKTPVVSTQENSLEAISRKRRHDNNDNLTAPPAKRSKCRGVAVSSSKTQQTSKSAARSKPVLRRLSNNTATSTARWGFIEPLHSPSHDGSQTADSSAQAPLAGRSTILRAAQRRRPTALIQVNHNTSQQIVSPEPLRPSPHDVDTGGVDRQRSLGRSPPLPLRSTRQTMELKKARQRTTTIQDTLKLATHSERTPRRSRRLAGLKPEFDLEGNYEGSRRSQRFVSVTFTPVTGANLNTE